MHLPAHRAGLGHPLYTDLAVFLIEPGGVVVRDVFGIDFDCLATLAGVPLVDGTSR